MFNILRNCSEIQTGSPEKLIVEGFGIHHLRIGREQIIPSIYSNKRYYSLIFNHEQVPITIDGKPSKPLLADTLVLWDLSHVVKYGAEKLHWSISWLQVNGEIIDSLIRQFQIPLNHPINFGNERLINNYWMLLLAELNEYSQVDITMVTHHITGILLEIKRNISLRQNDYSIPHKFRELRAMLDHNYRRKITLDELAKMFHVTPIYFSRKFKEYFGLSPIDYVIMLRLHEATLCLANEEMSIAEIAESVGYHDLFHFSKLFKRHYGVSPRKFRDALLNPQRFRS